MALLLVYMDGRSGSPLFGRMLRVVVPLESTRKRPVSATEQLALDLCPEAPLIHCSPD